MGEKTNYKLILAVLQGDDYHEVVSQLNQNGYYATLLHSSGGFLKKRSMTIMIGPMLHRYALRPIIGKVKMCGWLTKEIYSSV